MLDEIETDADGNLCRIRAHVGTYAENVYSTHVLEYELYRAYLEYGKKRICRVRISGRICATAYMCVIRCIWALGHQRKKGFRNV